GVVAAPCLHQGLVAFGVAAFVEEPDELQVLGRVLATHGESPLSRHPSSSSSRQRPGVPSRSFPPDASPPDASFPRSDEHTSELQSRENLVCRLLLVKT